MAYTGDNDDGDELFQENDDDKIEVTSKEGVHKNWVVKDDPFRYEWKDSKEMTEEENKKMFKRLLN